MNSDDIERILIGCRPTFVGVYSADNLPTAPPSGSVLICNTDPERLPGRHWIAMYLQNGGGEYFDSLGSEPPKRFVDYLDKHCGVGRWTFSTRQIQSAASSFCGHYCVYYTKLRTRGVDLCRIICLFTRDTGYNDALVHDFVCSSLLAKK